MNDLYALVNDLETAETSLDNAAAGRVTTLALKSLPQSRRRRWLPLILAAVLLLSACGYAVATGRFSSWFQLSTPRDMSAEAADDFFASMGTVINQRQTVNGVTVTLNAALYDGEILALSLTSEGSDPNHRRMEREDIMDAQKTFLANLASEKEIIASAHEKSPEASEDEIADYLFQSGQFGWYLEEQTYIRDRERERNGEEAPVQIYLFWKQLVPPVGTELHLHLENFIPNQYLLFEGPFDFTFTMPKDSEPMVYPGSVEIQASNGTDVTLSNLTIRSFYLEVDYIGTENIGTSYLDSAFRLTQIRIDGEDHKLKNAGGHAAFNEESGTCSGTSYTRLFFPSIDPVAVDAICIGGTWVKTAQFHPVKKSNSLLEGMSMLGQRHISPPAG